MILALMMVSTSEHVLEAASSDPMFSQRMERVEKHMGKMINRLDNINQRVESKKVKHEERSKKAKESGREIPKAKDLNGTVKVWDFLYSHADYDLIENTQSEEEEKKLSVTQSTNVVAYLLKTVENERADEWLIQLALWFHVVARGWPSSSEVYIGNVPVFENLISLINGDGTVLNEIDWDDRRLSIINSTDSVSKNDIKKVVPIVAISSETQANSSKPSELYAVNSTTTNGNHSEDVISKILETINEQVSAGELGPTTLIKFERMLETAETDLSEWSKQIQFAIGIFHAAPAFEEYNLKWELTDFSKVEQVVFEANKDKKDRQMQQAASLLSIISLACDMYPRMSEIVRNTFLKVLNDEEKAEKKSKDGHLRI